MTKRIKNEDPVLEQDKVKPGQLVITNRACIADILFLAMKYNPIFTKVDIDSKGQVGIRRIKGRELFSFAVGISMPERTKHELFTDFVKFRDSQADKDLRPIILFPEGTHSNGRGIL